MFLLKLIHIVGVIVASFGTMLVLFISTCPPLQKSKIWDGRLIYPLYNCQGTVTSHLATALSHILRIMSNFLHIFNEIMLNICTYQNPLYGVVHPGFWGRREQAQNLVSSHQKFHLGFTLIASRHSAKNDFLHGSDWTPLSLVNCVSRWAMPLS